MREHFVGVVTVAAHPVAGIFEQLTMLCRNGITRNLVVGVLRSPRGFRVSLPAQGRSFNIGEQEGDLPGRTTQLVCPDRKDRAAHEESQGRPIDWSGRSGSLSVPWLSVNRPVAL
jgi:hypothetical protein